MKNRNEINVNNIFLSYIYLMRDNFIRYFFVFIILINIRLFTVFVFVLCVELYLKNK